MNNTAFKWRTNTSHITPKCNQRKTRCYQKPQRNVNDGSAHATSFSAQPQKNKNGSFNALPYKIALQHNNKETGSPHKRTPHSTAPNDKQVGRRKVVWWMKETAAGAEREHRTLHEVTPTTETGRDRPHALPGVQRGGDGTHRSVCPEGPAATHGHGAGRGAQHSPRDPPRR